MSTKDGRRHRGRRKLTVLLLFDSAGFFLFILGCLMWRKKCQTNGHDGKMMIIERLGLLDDVARLHVEIDKLNDLLVGFCFIRDIDTMFGKQIITAGKLTE
jgi:hypothetical protein